MGGEDLRTARLASGMQYREYAAALCTRVLAARLAREGFATYRPAGSWNYMQRPMQAAIAA
jgi:hypothetical protein